MDELINRFLKAPPAVKYGGLAAVLVAITVLNFFMVIQPIEENIQRQVATQKQLDVQLAEKQEIAQNLNERRREMDVLEQDLAVALTQLPETADIDELLAQLNDIGKKAGLSIASVQPGKESNASFYARIPVKMEVEGNFHEIAMFLQDVSSMRRIVNVDTIKFSDPKVKNEKVVLQANFLATTFRFLDQPAKQGDNPKKTPAGKK
ncbi:MAG: type 4a pilus biogenesis protein PilO [Myxococcota bacterium]|nr:type 4a pilus biogenesis protein PilO [Myxococcota bacterium]